MSTESRLTQVYLEIPSTIRMCAMVGEIPMSISVRTSTYTVALHMEAAPSSIARLTPLPEQ